MTSKICYLLFIIGLFTVGKAQAQSSATEQGAKFIAGNISFTSQGNEFTDGRITRLDLTPTILYFVVDRLGVGGNLSLTYSSFNQTSFTSLGVGPKASYFFDSESDAIPYLTVAANYLFSNSENNFSSDKNTGYTFNFGGGVAIRKDHLGILLEGGFQLGNLNANGVGVNTNNIYLSIGIAGFLFDE